MERVICGLSGGVDSSVAAALLHRAIGDQLTCIFVNNGLLRKHETQLRLLQTFQTEMHARLVAVDAVDAFLGTISRRD